jgi:hypothetical protein
MLLRILRGSLSGCSGRGSAKVGWFFDDDKNSVIFHEPERLKTADMNRAHAKSASRCPAVVSLESRYFVVRCPFDLQLKFMRDADGQPKLANLMGDASPMRPKALSKYLSLTNEREWRYPDRPTLQVVLPYVFVADEPVYISQLPPFLHHLERPWPGTLFGGRFPIHIWPRPLMWAFEWHDKDRPLVLRRGDPWFYVAFETTSPERPLHLVPAQKTPELVRYMSSISGTVNYVNQTFGLFKVAQGRRPPKLLVPVSSG